MSVGTLRVWGVILVAAGLLMWPAHFAGYSDHDEKWVTSWYEDGYKQRRNCYPEPDRHEPIQCKTDRANANYLDRGISGLGVGFVLLGAVWVVKGFGVKNANTPRARTVRGNGSAGSG